MRTNIKHWAGNVWGYEEGKLMGKTFGIGLVFVLRGALPAGMPVTVRVSFYVIDYRLQFLE